MSMNSVHWIERAAVLCFRLRYSVAARTATIILLLAAAAAVLFARPAQLTDRSVRPSMISDVDSSLIGEYVRVSGMFRPDETMKRYLRLRDVLGKGYGPNFAVLIDPSSGALLWVREEPSLTREPNASAMLVGRVSVGVGDEPPLYLLVRRPPLVVAAEWLTRSGAALLVLGPLIILLVLGAERIQFALPSLWRPSAAAADSTHVLSGASGVWDNFRTPSNHAIPAPEGSGDGVIREFHPPQTANAPILFYGGLGYLFDDLQLRAAPVRFDVSVHEVRITPVEQHAWSISVRRVTLIDLYDVASSAGPLAGMWLRFEDDRGLARTAVLATPSVRARAALVEILSNLRT